MRGFMNSLTLQALLLVWIICSANGAPYSSEYKCFNHCLTVNCGGTTQRVQVAVVNPAAFPLCRMIDCGTLYFNRKHFFSAEYGRTCKDIGCLPRETCVMAYESCSFSQQENVSCGRYPTCKKITDGSATQQNSGNLSWSH